MNSSPMVSVDRNSGSGRNSILFFALAVVFRCLGMIGRFDAAELNYVYRVSTELVLPIVFCSLMILCVVLLGKNHFWLSLLPVMTGVLFFLLRILSTDNILARTATEWSVAAHVCVYLAVFLLYAVAVLRIPFLKWILVPVYILGMIYHLVFEDYPAIAAGGDSLSFSTVMMEISVLFMLLGMLFVTFAVKRPSAAVTEAEQPDPVKPVPSAEKAAAPDKPAAAEKAPSDKAAETKASGFFGFFKKLFGGKKNKAGEKSASSETDKTDEGGTVSAPESAAASGDASAAELTGEKPGEMTGEKPEDSTNGFSKEPAADTADAEAPEAPVLDESFFDTPYTPVLTLDPTADTASGDDSEI